MYEMIINVISKFGYLGIFLLIMIENIFPPIPSEVILTFSGFIAKDANLNLLLIIIYSTMGSLIGALILYFLGYFLNNQIFYKIIDNKIGKILHLSHDDINNSIDKFKKDGYKSIFFGRLVPIIRSVISIPAGLSKMNIFIFLLYTTLGTLIWNSILILLGNMVGENFLLVANFVNTYYKYIIILIIIIYIIRKILLKKSNN